MIKLEAKIIETQTLTLKLQFHLLRNRPILISIFTLEVDKGNRASFEFLFLSRRSGCFSRKLCDQNVTQRKIDFSIIAKHLCSLQQVATLIS